MGKYYDKDKLKASLEIENIFDLLELWGGEPEYAATGLIAHTICHNKPGEGSRKLYYFSNTKLFKCWTGCPETHAYDIFQLAIKVAKIQRDEDWELYDAMSYIAGYFGIEGETLAPDAPQLADWKVFQRHDINRERKVQIPRLREYPDITRNLAHPRILTWEDEGISPRVVQAHNISYYPTTEQIVIPHYDIQGRLVGVRGRFLAEESADRYGKYLPLRVGSATYNHPLSANLYGIEKTKDNISANHLAIVVESEKGVLQLESMYGAENNIAVACCGSSISRFQVDILLSLGTREIIVAFDKDFSEIGDEIFKRQKNKVLQLKSRYSAQVKMSFLWDKNDLLPRKASPTDAGKEIFETLLNERIRT